VNEKLKRNYWPIEEHLQQEMIVVKTDGDRPVIEMDHHVREMDHHVRERKVVSDLPVRGDLLVRVAVDGERDKRPRLKVGGKVSLKMMCQRKRVRRVPLDLLLLKIDGVVMVHQGRIALPHRVMTVLPVMFGTRELLLPARDGGTELHPLVKKAVVPGEEEETLLVTLHLVTVRSHGDARHQVMTAHRRVRRARGGAEIHHVMMTAVLHHLRVMTGDVTIEVLVTTGAPGMIGVLHVMTDGEEVVTGKSAEEEEEAVAVMTGAVAPPEMPAERKIPGAEAVRPGKSVETIAAAAAAAAVEAGETVNVQQAEEAEMREVGETVGPLGTTGDHPLAETIEEPHPVIETLEHLLGQMKGVPGVGEETIGQREAEKIVGDVAEIQEVRLLKKNAVDHHPEKIDHHHVPLPRVARKRRLEMMDGQLSNVKSNINPHLLTPYIVITYSILLDTLYCYFKLYLVLRVPYDIYILIT